MTREMGDGKFVCSNCDTYPFYYEDFEDFNYCPECGLPLDHSEVKSTLTKRNSERQQSRD
jgi:predicted amidophosphoribosyltransferase